VKVLKTKEISPMTKTVDEIIRKAMELGKFDNLTNTGKKLNLKDYFDTPEDLRIGYSVLKSADFVPEKVQLLKEIGELQEKLAKVSNEAGQKNCKKR
jgi:hypothetical protein